MSAIYLVNKDYYCRVIRHSVAWWIIDDEVREYERRKTYSTCNSEHVCRRRYRVDATATQCRSMTVVVRHHSSTPTVDEVRRISRSRAS